MLGFNFRFSFTERCFPEIFNFIENIIRCFFFYYFGNQIISKRRMNAETFPVTKFPVQFYM